MTGPAEVRVGPSPGQPLSDSPSRSGSVQRGARRFAIVGNESKSCKWPVAGAGPGRGPDPGAAAGPTPAGPISEQTGFSQA